MKHFDSQMFTLLDELVVEHDVHCRALEAINDTIDAAERYQDRSLLPLIGPSRSGKTTLMKITLKHHLAKAKEGGVPCGLRYMMLPKTHKTKAVLMKMQYALGYPLFHVGSEAEMHIRIIDLLRRQGVTTLLLDELQHSVSANGAVNFEIADLFKSILDEAGVQIIGGGLEEALALLQSNEQLMGRCVQAVELSRSDWTREDDRAMFIGIVQAFRDGLPGMKMPAFDNDDAGFRWYVASGGLIGYVHKVFRKVLDLAAKDDRVRVTWEDLDAAQQSAVYYHGPQVRPFDRSFDIGDVAAGVGHAHRIGERPAVGDAIASPTTTRRHPRLSKRALREAILMGE